MKHRSLIVFAILLCSAAMNAQPQAAPVPAVDPQAIEGGVPSYIKPETAEQRKARLGTVDDPGLTPDPTKVFWRFGRGFTIERFERRFAAYDQVDGWVRPMGMVNFAAEIYQQNDKYIWVWIMTPESIAADVARMEAEQAGGYNKASIDFLTQSRPQFTPLDPPTINKVVRFESASAGLPQGGSWRSSLDVADMNGDGHLDLIAPPQRAVADGTPAIFLGDGKGNWRHWDVAKWPKKLDYGSVAAADFNRDGHQDLAFGVHLDGVYIFLGDGKGGFVEVESNGAGFASRRVATADVDADGDMDVVAITEGPTRGSVNLTGGAIRVFVNDKKGTSWRMMDIAPPGKRAGADWMTVANLDGDRYPDVIGSSLFFNSMDTFYLGTGKLQWKSVESGGDVIPSLAYYFANTAGRYSSAKKDDAIVTYVRTWPGDLDPAVVPKPALEQVTSIDRLTFTKSGPQRVPIARWGGSYGVPAMGAGDFDGDGKADLLFVRYDPREAVLLLGDGKGGFRRATVEGFPVPTNETYDMRVADVNRDGKPDVVMMYESSGTTALAPRDGSIQVFLNRGSSAPAAGTSK